MTWGHGGRARPRKYSYDDQKVVFDLVTEVRQLRNCSTAEALVEAGVTLTRFQCARQALAKGRSPDDPPGTRMDRSHDAAYRRLLKREPPGGMPAASSPAGGGAPAELVRCFVIEGSAAAVRHVLEVFLGA